MRSLGISFGLMATTLILSSISPVSAAARSISAQLPDRRSESIDLNQQGLDRLNSGQLPAALEL